MPAYQELVTWSPTFGGECARISMVDERGSEYFSLLPYSDDRAYRALRKRAIEVLSEAIDSDMGAGEYRWRTSA
jgi:hypothetical protein